VYPDIERINQASDVPTGTVLWASCSRNLGSIPSRARGFDLLRSDQTGSQTHIAFYSIGTGITVSGNNHSPDLMPTLRMNDGAFPTNPYPHAPGNARSKSMHHIPDDPSSETFRG